MAFNYEQIIVNKEESIGILESFLYDAILAWYDDSSMDYHGLNDKEFVSRVCERTGLSEHDYRSERNGRKNNVQI